MTSVPKSATGTAGQWLDRQWEMLKPYIGMIKCLQGVSNPTNTSHHGSSRPGFACMHVRQEGNTL
eukprot:4422051-Prorocentrum_lima.AAC.1